MKILSPKILEFYDNSDQNTGFLRKFLQKFSILTKKFIEVQYFDKYFHRSPVFWDLEFLQISRILFQNSKSKIPIVDNQPPGIGSTHLYFKVPVFYCLIKKFKIPDFYEIFCQNTGLLQKISQKSSILTKNFIEVQYFDKKIHRSPVFYRNPEFFFKILRPKYQLQIISP